MQISLYTVIVVVLFLLISAFLSYLGYRNTKNAQDYLVAGRKIHPLVMALSYGATFISTSAIVGFGGLAATMGLGLLWLTFLNIFLGIFIAFIFFGKRTRRMGHTLDAHTFPEFLSLRFQSRFVQGFAGALIFLGMPIYAASIIKGGANFIESYFNISYSTSLLFFVAIVAIYVWVGGLKGVMYTDAFQATIMFVAMIILLIFTYSKLGGVVNAHQQLSNLFSNPAIQEKVAKSIAGGFNGWTSMPVSGSPMWWGLVSTIIAGVGIGVLSQPQLVVRFMTVKSDRELNRAVLSGGVFILAMTGVAFVVGALTNVIFFNDTGMTAIEAAGGVNDKIIPTFISSYIPEWFAAVFLTSMLAAAMSTLSSQFHTMGTAAGRDLYEKNLPQKRQYYPHHPQRYADHYSHQHCHRLGHAQSSSVRRDHCQIHFGIFRAGLGYLPSHLHRGAVLQKDAQKGRGRGDDFRCGRVVYLGFLCPFQRVFLPYLPVAFRKGQHRAGYGARAAEKCGHHLRGPAGFHSGHDHPMDHLPQGHRTAAGAYRPLL